MSDTVAAMTLGTFCSGIGAPECAGMGRPLWFCEIEPFPSAVLAHHYPGVPNFGDMTAPDLVERIAAAGLPDIIVAGLPCQPFSVAGLRKGLEDPRNLTARFVEIADAIDDLRRASGQRPVWWCVENVPGLLSDGGNAFGALLGGLVGDDSAIVPPERWTNAGVVSGPRRVAAWRILDARHFGVAQRRRRVFVLALGGTWGWACADALLPIAESLSGHPAPGGEAGEGVARPIAAGSPRGSGYRNDADTADNLIAVTLNANGKAAGSATTQDAENGLLIAHALRAEGFDASEDGTGRGTPLVPVSYRTSGNCGAWETGATTDALTTATDPNHHVVAFQTRGSNLDVGDISGTIGSNADRASGSAPMVAFSCKDHGADYGGTAPTLRAMGHSGSHANAGGQVAVAFDTTQITSSANYSNPKPGDPCHPLAAGAHAPALASTTGVRRIMPPEAERLQGFPPGWTAILYRGKPAADGPRYRCLGNSMAVPCMAYIGQRIRAADARARAINASEAA